jgi:hypothetical protein
MAKEKKQDGRVGFHFKVDAQLLSKFKTLAKQHSINTGEEHSATSLLTGLMSLAVSKPEILNQIEGKNNEC